ncbi:MAG: phosphogluconate dehydrogenase (NAD(+)-dependent, decarboxylating) [Tepidiformaceae bacterium]
MTTAKTDADIAISARPMTIGMVGQGRMGAGMTKRLRTFGHEIVAYDRNPAVSDVASLKELVDRLPSPKVVWLMVPSGAITQSTVEEVAPLLSPGDIVIDGGNSYVKDTVRRGKELTEQGINYLDVGTSGGIWGFENGFCLMAGGDREVFDHVEPILESLAPQDGYAYVGGPGAGHYSKMVHNGIEYGMLQAYAEGFDLLQAAEEYDFDLHQLSKLWNHSSVVRSWLLELAENAFAADPKLATLEGYVDDSGEGRWTVLEAVERGVNVSVLAQALFSRFTSREADPFSMRVIAALRNQFGGHAVKHQ